MQFFSVREGIGKELENEQSELWCSRDVHGSGWVS